MSVAQAVDSKLTLLLRCLPSASPGPCKLYQPHPSRLVDSQDEDTTKSLGELLHTRRGLASVILEGLALVGMVPFLWIELSTFCEYGPRIWLNTWNCLDCLTYAGQVSLP